VTTGKQSRLTSEVPPSADEVGCWSVCVKVIDTARCRRQIHIARQTGYENIAPRGPRKWGSSCGLSSGRDGHIPNVG
jgi:hypothetical protein